MKIYQITSYIFPENFTLRVMSLCFLGTHIPIIAFMGWEIYRSNFDLGAIGAVLIGTIIGTGMTLALVAGLLKPVRVATDALIRYGEHRIVPILPTLGPDLVGELMQGVDTAVNSSETMIAQLDEAANTDALTGLANRRAFLSRARAVVEGGHGATIAILDVDHFKLVNDRFGHEEGDRILRDVAGLLQTGVREVDFVARWGGEEFAVLFSGEHEGEASGILERVRKRIETAKLLDLDGAPVTVSGGISAVQPAEQTVDEALRRADQLLYAAKRGGRNRLALALAA